MIIIKEDLTKLKSNEDNNMYIKIGIFVFIIIALWIFKQCKKL
jgi:hypothetical protein